MGCLVGLLVWSAVPAFALPQTSSPELDLDRTIQTTPFVGTSVLMTRVLMLVSGLEVRIVSEDGELLRALTLDPTRSYQPLGRR